MEVVADESVDGVIVSKLRENGCSVFYIAEQAAGAIDERVLKIANQKKLILLTEDKDFGELVYRLKLANCGVVLIRLSGWESSKKGSYVSGIIRQHLDELKNAFTVISTDKVRVRKQA